MKLLSIVSLSTLLVGTISAAITPSVSSVQTMLSRENDTSNDDGATSVRVGARVARTLMHRESLADVSALDVKTDIPVEFTEYFVDGLNNGNPVLVLVDMSSTHRNVNHTQSQGIKTSISVRTGDHQPWDTSRNFTLKYPGSFENSIAGSPRLSLTGEFKPLTLSDTQEKEITSQFLERHPDSKYWLPGQKWTAHAGAWYYFDVESIYLLGGFGNLAYIGDIPLEEYKNAFPYTEYELKALQKQLDQ